MSSNASTSAASASPENADQNPADQRKKNLLSGLENLKAKMQKKLNDDSLYFGKKEYYFKYYGEHQNDKEPRKGFLYGLGYEAFEAICKSVGLYAMNERDILNYDTRTRRSWIPEAEPQIDWDNDVAHTCYNSSDDDVLIAYETILEDIIGHLKEGKSVAIGPWSYDREIPLTIHDFNVGTMGAQEIYERLSTFDKKCNSMQIIPCTTGPFLGCYIICDENGMYGQKLNRMASYFLKKQVYGGRIYGNVLLTRHVD